MFFPSHSWFDFGILVPEEVAQVCAVLRRVASEPGVSKTPEDLVALGRYAIQMYQGGLRDEQKLFELCLNAARRKSYGSEVRRERVKDRWKRRKESRRAGRRTKTTGDYFPSIFFMAHFIGMLA
jgi:hypothetical protein